MTYVPQRVPWQENVHIRGLRHRLTWWGERTNNPIVLLHGYLDCGATWQFLVDRLPPSWTFVAPDWRGGKLPVQLRKMTRGQYAAYRKFMPILGRTIALEEVKRHSSGSTPPPPARTAAARVSASAPLGDPSTLPPAGREI